VAGLDVEVVAACKRQFYRLFRLHELFTGLWDGVLQLIRE
jgi:hypothetical protein